MLAIENKMTELGNKILLPAQAALNYVGTNKFVEVQDFLSALDHLGRAMEPLKVYATTFKNSAPNIHSRLQKMIENFGEKATLVEQNLCKQVKLKFKPNPEIPDLGDCMFDSIKEELKSKKKQDYFRKQAVAYIRENKEDIFVQDRVEDAMASTQARSSIVRYAKSQSGLKESSTDEQHLNAWKNKLQKKLNLKSDQKPSDIDLYCDCMENHSLWGGTNELFALSEKLKVPILVFAPNKLNTWRLDFVTGRPQYNDKPPLLLYYNGVNHYQNLI